MKRRLLIALALVTATAALVAAGCGGSSRDKAYAGSKADFAAAMSSICASVNAKIKEIGVGSLDDLATKGPQVIDAIKAGVKKLKKLEPPAEIKSNVDSFLSLSDQTISKLGDLVDAAKKKDEAAATKLQGELDALDKQEDADAKAIGATACLSGS